jgi:AcrR family transcriptional regulator
MDTPSQETRSALLQAALVCFAEHSFDGTSMRMIADRAGRPLSLLAHHFGNKEGLYIEVFKLILEHKMSCRSHEAAWVEGWAPRDRADAVRSLREQFHRMYEDVLPMAGDGTEVDPVKAYGARLWLQEMQSPRPELRPVLRQYLGPQTEYWRRVIHFLRPDLAAEEVACIGMSVIGMVVAHGLMSGVNEPLWGDRRPVKNTFQAAELLVDLCLNGLLSDRRP